MDSSNSTARRLIRPIDVARTAARSSRTDVTPTLADVRKQIEEQIIGQHRKDAYGPLAHNTKTNSQRAETNAAHRIEFMRKIDEGKMSFDDSNSAACVFQQLHLNDNLLDDFDRMKVNVSNYDDTSIGKRHANSRRIVIPLAPGDRGKLSSSSNEKQIAAEYAARYCEMLNVTPTSRNLALIQKKIPITSCTVSQLYNAGQARNNIVIEPSHVRVKQQPKDTTDDIVYSLLTSETVDSAIGKQGSDKPNFDAAVRMRSPKNQIKSNTHEHARFPSFDEYKYRFVFPFNVNEIEVSTQKSREGRPKIGETGQKQGSQIDILDSLLARGAAIVRGEKSSKSVDPKLFSTQESINNGILKELTSPIVPSDSAEIQSFLRQFVIGFPWSKLDKRITPSGVEIIQQSLRSQDMIMTCRKVCELLHGGYIGRFSSSGISVTAMQLEDLFVEVVSLLAVHIKSPDSLEHALRLLAVRVVTLAELTSRLPLFAVSEVGEEVKCQIDTLITAIGDPTGLICRIPTLESSPQALRMIRLKRLPRLSVANYRSPMAHLLLGNGDDQSSARSLAFSEHFSAEVRELRKFVSPRIRKQLISILKISSSE